MAYIESDVSLFRHHRAKKAARILGIPTAHLVGCLVCIWSRIAEFPLTYLVDGMEIWEVVDASGWIGNEDDLINALIGTYFLEWRDGAIFPKETRIIRVVPTALEIRRIRWDARQKFAPVIFARDRYQCVYCGSSEDLTLDHVVPVTRGGINTVKNLVTACRSCNSSKNDKTPEEWL